ncbi:hypothetical protein CBS101457_003300 [Exobasidium rhododendri]|nr:hypothetical protein CBS101457_003300 [Exobasidium rhododendri]
MEEEEGAVEHRVIQRLPEHVVNKIAAGEIIHRPSNALKEMMENSLDAGATMIRIQLKDGGLKMLQIQDDGSGVAPSDMPLLCERFATSKLRDFSDLSKMTTFGFRGEALASISYVSASMNVLSKTHDSEVAYKVGRACYSSGRLVPPKPGQSSAPRPSAGSQGTTITIEDLFYNIPQRRRALKSAAEEYNMALDVVSKYAVHYGGRGIGFTCKKASANAVDLSVPSSPQTKTIDAIGSIYGSSVAKELQQLSQKEYPALGCSVQGWVSGANWSAKRVQFLCFINNRLVDCPALKRSLVALYSTLLPRGGHPWIYLSLILAPEKVDVNVHPTKREVHFLDEEEIVEVICSQVQDLLANANTSRSFNLTQAILSNVIQPSGQGKRLTDSPGVAVQPSSRPGYPQHTVRVDGKSRTLDAMAGFESQSARSTNSEASSRSKVRGEEQGWTVETQTSPSATLPPKIEESKTTLRSVYELREEVKSKRHHGLSSLFQDYTLVGVADTTKFLALLQHGTKLYLVQYGNLMQEAAYQTLLRQFGSLPPIRLSPAPLLSDLIEAALTLEYDSQDERRELGLSEEGIIDKVCSRLCLHAAMLKEYFSLEIDVSTGSVIAIPSILPSRVIFNLERLPTLLLRLATQVDWTDEVTCFKIIMQELAFAHVPCAAIQEAEEANTKEQVEKDWLAGWNNLLRVMVPTTTLLAEKNVTEVASLPSLYSVFERC